MPPGDVSHSTPPRSFVAVAEDRVAYLPQGGVFAPFLMAPGGIRLSGSLAQPLAQLRPPPLALIGIVQRVLDDLDVLHREGGAHGALSVEGVGLGMDGTFGVWPMFSEGEVTPTGDVRALGVLVSGLLDADTLVAAGISRAKAWYSGLGVGGGRVGFGDARAARQGLLVAARGLRIEEARDSFLSASGGRLPTLPRHFGVRPVLAAPGVQANRQRDDRTREARAWLDRATNLARQDRHARESAVAADLARVTEELRERTDAVIESARAISEAEAAHLGRVTQTAGRSSQGPAMFFVPSGHSPMPIVEGLPDAAAGDEELEIESPSSEDSADDGTFDSTGGITFGVDPERGEAFAESVRASPADARRPDVEDAGADSAEAARVAAEERAAEELAGLERAAERIAEAERQAAEDRGAEAAKLAAAERQDEAERVATETRLAEEERAAEAAKFAAAAQSAEAERVATAASAAEAERQAAADRLAEEERVAEAAKLAEAGRQAEAKRVAAAAQLAEEERQAEAKRVAAAASAAEAERQAEAKRVAVAAELAEEERQAEAKRVAVAAELAEEERQAEAGKLAERHAMAAERPALADEPTPLEPKQLKITLQNKRSEPPATPETWPPQEDELSDERERPAVARWEGAVGVTGDDSRMHEKGPGKWTLQGRSREELAEQLPPGESRPMDLDLSKRNAGLSPLVWVGAVAALFAAAAWYLS